MFAAILSYIVADKIAKSSQINMPQAITVQKKTGQTFKIEIAMKDTSYDFQQRFETLKSLPALGLFGLGVINYIFSFAFKGSYEAFNDLPAVVNDPNGCTVPGANILAFYSIVLVMGTGSSILGVFGLAFLYKIINLLAVVICPVTMVSCKKKLHNKPKNFSHYENEFDFSIDYNEDPECHPGIVTQSLQPPVE